MSEFLSGSDKWALGEVLKMLAFVYFGTIGFIVLLLAALGTTTLIVIAAVKVLMWVFGP